jgi:hypothetical protein
MKSKWFLLAKALISIVIAIFMLFFATTFLGWFLTSSFLGKVPDALAGGLAQMAPALAQPVTDLHAGLAGVVKIMSAFFGAMLIGVGLICYFASGATASVLRKKVILSLAVADTLGFIFTLMAQIKGLFSGLGWIIVALWLVLAAFLWFFFFTEKTA